MYKVVESSDVDAITDVLLFTDISTYQDVVRLKVIKLDWRQFFISQIDKSNCWFVKKKQIKLFGFEF